MFDATLALQRREIDHRSLSRVLMQYPVMTIRVITAIYYQALGLWLKKSPFYSHPGKRAATNPEKPL
ncbi:DUF1365 family protein [Nitrosococcus halophilus]|uniref:DUF1365 family protein n=1 Tax=Nitrosococcus halophilus TaxID=133539 RepID=UPI0023AF5776|nr:DUF1365 family protein [Nitrosococcus halophilus]